MVKQSGQLNYMGGFSLRVFFNIRFKWCQVMVKVVRLFVDLWIVDILLVWLSDYCMFFFYIWVCIMYLFGIICGLLFSQFYRNQ